MLSKEQAKKKVLDYLKNSMIPYKFLDEVKEKGNLIPEMKNHDSIHICTEIPEVIGKHIETMLRFYDDHLYCQSYYCMPITDNKEESIRAARLINYINLHLEYDPEYNCDNLYPHIFMLDDENGYIMNGCLIRYELLLEYFQESMDHILNLSVQQLKDVCPAIVFYTMGEIDYFTATKRLIDYAIMGKETAGPEYII